MPQSDPSNKVVFSSVLIGASLLLLILLIPIALFGLLYWDSPLDFFGGWANPDAGLEVGQPAPALVAEGWLNGNAPTAESLEGKVVVVDAWASW